MTDSGSQEQLVKQLSLLLKNRFGSAVEVIETHISVILLVDKFAFKIKKPVDFGFLNFTSLEKRRFFCNEELRLNRRLAPDYYIDVNCVTASTDHSTNDIEINGTGKVLEYMVKMQRFDQEGQLDVLLKQKRLTHHHIDELARVVTAFHASIAVASRETLPDLVNSIEQAVKQNFEQIAPYTSRFSEKFQSVFLSIKAWSEEKIQHFNPIFQHRLEQGFIRECHGDMHTGNIAWHKEQLVIFDAIEFNPDFRWIDVMSEMAFITMDLEFNGRPDLSYRLMNRYLESTGDYHGLNLLRFYQVYRSMVRAKVNCLRLSQLDSQDPQYQKTLNTVYQYLDSAYQFTRTNETFIIITQGVSGSGKSFVSQQLLEQFQMIRIRSDVERKRLYPEKNGRYLPEATDRTYEYLHELAGNILAYGYPVVLDATYLKKSFRLNAKAVAVQSNQKFFILSLTHDKEVLEKRIKKRLDKPDNPSEATIEVMHRQLNSMDPFEDKELAYVVTVDNNETVVETFKDHLKLATK